MSSTNDLPYGSAHNEFEDSEVGTQVRKQIAKRTWYGKAANSFILGLLFISLAMVFLAMRIGNNEGFCDVVPTLCRFLVDYLLPVVRSCKLQSQALYN